MNVEKSFEIDNKQKYGLEGNTSYLAFKDGKMISTGHLNDITIKIDLRYCKGCGICMEECPTGSLNLELEKGNLRDSIHASYPAPPLTARTFDPNQLLTWQELPHHGGLIVTTALDSYNLTGAWRVGEVVIGNADKCVLCGLCYLHCPEDVICIETGDAKKNGHRP